MINFDLFVKTEDFDEISKKFECWTCKNSLSYLADIALKVAEPKISIAVEGGVSFLSFSESDVYIVDLESEGNESEALSGCSTSENSLKDTPPRLIGSM
jgi:hypothetical protein